MMTTTTGTINLFRLVVSGLLVAIGIIIPLTFPRLWIEPASYTLASHVVIFIAMFISPKVAFAVALGTTAGFFFYGLPLNIVFRALTHVVWATAGAYYLSKIDKLNIGPVHLRLFSLAIALLHGALEFLVILAFFFGTSFPEGQDAMWVFIFIGIGTVIHSMVDLEIANFILKRLLKSQRTISLFS